MKKCIKIRKLLVVMAATLACTAGIMIESHAVQVVPQIGGYIAAEPEASSEGFKVEIIQPKFEAYTNANGFYRFNTDDRVATQSICTFKISKKGYLTRYISNVPFNSYNISIGTAKEPVSILAGDVNSDDTINMNDIVLMAKAFNTTSTDNEFNEAADMNFDKSINMSDVVIIAKNFNKSSSDYGVPVIE
ncbi:MAG: dockerin type I domain-containing protein [Bacillota bacterium]|nr:dockerin type I domain-containing protein [Bacillota bacterium]